MQPNKSIDRLAVLRARVTSTRVLREMRERDVQAAERALHAAVFSLGVARQVEREAIEDYENAEKA